MCLIAATHNTRRHKLCARARALALKRSSCNYNNSNRFGSTTLTLFCIIACTRECRVQPQRTMLCVYVRCPRLVRTTTTTTTSTIAWCTRRCTQIREERTVYIYMRESNYWNYFGLSRRRRRRWILCSSRCTLLRHHGAHHGDNTKNMPIPTQTHKHTHVRTQCVVMRTARCRTLVMYCVQMGRKTRASFIPLIDREFSSVTIGTESAPNNTGSSSLF